MAKPDETVDKTMWHEHERLSEDFCNELSEPGN